MVNEKDSLTALAVSVMIQTAERVGNPESAEDGHYGITMLKKKHVEISGNKVLLRYTGKSGVEQEKSFVDEIIASALKKAIKNSPSQFIFTTREGFQIKADRVNRFLENNFNVTAKDLRGFLSNQYLVEKLKTLTPDKDEVGREKQFRETVKYAAEKVGHGAATLKKHYMLPELEKKWIKYGKILDLADFYKTGGLVKMGKGGEITIEEYDEETATPINRDYYGNAGAGVFIISANTGRGLLLKRGNDCKEAGTWAFIGGRIEGGEDAAHAAKREVKEEINYTIKSPLHLAFIYRDGDFAYYNYIAVVANEFKPNLNYENVDYRWVELDKLPEPIHFGVSQMYENIKIYDEIGTAAKLFKRRAKKFEDGGDVDAVGAEVINGFYSPLEKKILDAPQSVYSAGKWKELIGVNNDEAIFMGILDFIGNENEKKISRNELLSFIKTHRIKIEEVVKGESDVIPFDKLREEVQQILEKAKYVEDVDGDELKKFGYKLALDPTDGTILGVTQAETKGLKYRLFQLVGVKESYKEIVLTAPDFKISGNSLLHYDERNAIAHMRVNVRVDSRGARTLFIEEIQSDVAGIVRRDKVEPQLPFTSKTSLYLKLCLKYAIRHAIAENCVAIAWTTGEQQTERYDLNKEVQDLYYDLMDDGIYLTGVRNGYEILDKKFKRESLPALVGAEVAEMILQNKGEKPTVKKYADYTGCLHVDDLKVNNKGLIDFYGSTTTGAYGIVGDVAVSLLKELHDASQLTMIEINLGAARQPIVWSSDGKGSYTEPNGFIISNSSDKKYPFKLISPYGDALGVFETLDGVKARVEMELNSYVDVIGGWSKQWGFYVYENIKDRIYKGIPIYKNGGEVDPEEQAGYKAIAGHDAAGRDIPVWADAVVYHTTDAKGLEDIRVNGYRLLGKEQGGYYGHAISFTPDIEYTKNFGGHSSITTKAKVSSDVKILNINVESDFKIFQEITGGKPDLRDLGEKMMAAGYDGLYDAGAGDLFIYNPKVVTYIGIEQGSRVDVKQTLEREVKDAISGDYVFLYSATSPANWKKILKSGKFKAGTVFFTNEAEARAYGREVTPRGEEILNMALIYIPSLVYDNGRYLNYEDLYYSNSRYSPKSLKMADGGSFEAYKKEYEGDGSFNRPYDLRMEFPELLYTSEPNPKEKKRFEKWLSGNKDKYVVMYHGSPHDRKESILNKGLLPTTEKRRNSYQSASGYVYLSVFPTMAKQFADMASPERNGKVNDVWEIVVQIRNLLPDEDQLRNQRQFAHREVNDTLADSFIYGHGARIRGKADRNLMKLADRNDVSYFNLGGAVGMDVISCDDCDWTWQAKDDSTDKYVCGNCGHDNTPVYEHGGDIPISKWEMPSKRILNYAEEIRTKYPDVWALGGNVFGNTAYELLKFVIKRGHWIEDEEDFYKKWQSFKARHAHDYRIAGVIANLKWLAWVEKGEGYSKDIINQAIEKKYSIKLEKGGHVYGERIMNGDGGYDYISDNDLQIAKEADIITLPTGVKGTNCGNCLFNGNNFCDNKKVLLPVTSRMCCALWTDKSVVSAITNVFDADFFADKDKSSAKLNNAGGYDYEGAELKRAEKADLITLPKSVEGTNCANCMYGVDGGLFCNHPKIQLPVTERMSCSWWNNADVVRKWGKPVETKFEAGGEVDGISVEQDGEKYTFWYKNAKATVIYYGGDKGMSPDFHNVNEAYIEGIHRGSSGLRTRDEESRGAGAILLNYIRQYFKDKGADVLTLKVENGLGFAKRENNSLADYYLKNGFEYCYTVNECALDEEKNLGAMCYRYPKQLEKGGGVKDEQYETIIHSESFKSWFGDWEQAYKKAKLDFSHPAWNGVSKVVDKNGKPLIVYHGTTQEFYKFAISKAKGQTNSDWGYMGFYFTANKELALDFTRKDWTNTKSPLRSGAKVMACFLNLKTPNIMPARSAMIMAVHPRQIRKNEIRDGFDGWILTPFTKADAASASRLFGDKWVKEFMSNQYVAFYPNQIKLADGTNVEFDSSTPDIRFEAGGDIDEETVKNLIMQGKTEYDIDRTLFPNKKSHASKKDELKLMLYRISVKLLFEGVVSNQVRRYAVFDSVFSHKATKQSVLDELNDGAFEKYIEQGIATKEQVNAILAKHGIGQKFEAGGVIPSDAGLVFATTDDIKFEKNLSYWNGIIRKFKLPFELKKYLGSGADGFAYETTKGTVVKFTENEEEAFIALLIKSEEKNLHAQTKIYNVYKILDRNKGVFLIEKEKTSVLLAQVKEGGDEFVKEVKAILKNVRQLMSRGATEQDIIERYRKSKAEFYSDLPSKFTQEKFEKMLRAYIDFWERLGKDKAQLGSGFDDSNISNIGYVDGKLYCFDCVADVREMAEGGDIMALGGSLQSFREYIPKYKELNKLPKQDISAEALGKMERLVEYISFLKTQQLRDITSQFMPVYFGQMINGIAYELYFPEVKAAKREILEHLGSLPPLRGFDREKMQIIRRVFNRLNEKDNPVRVNLFFMDSIQKIKDIEGKYAEGGAVDDYAKWKRANVTYRGMREAGQPNSSASGVLGRGLYTAPSSNKAMARDYGIVYFMINARPKNPKKFDSMNRWEIWFQNNLLMKYAVGGFPDLREFNKHTTIEKEMEALGYDGIEIEGREMVNFKPENVRHFKDEQDVRRYYESSVNNVA